MMWPPPPGTRVSEVMNPYGIDGSLGGIYVQIDVEHVRENTQDDYKYQGWYGSIELDQAFNAFPVLVNLEGGGPIYFWRHSLKVTESSTCSVCRNRFRGIDYLCQECRE